MRPIDADNLRGRVCGMFLCAEPGSAEETRFSLILGLIDSEHTITLPPNDPLTLDELREMDGEPVWICDPDGTDGMWALVDLEHALCRTAKGGIAIFDTYGKSWLAYRRKPEEGTT